MAVYKRGDKGVLYMNFTVDGVRVTRSTGKFNKKEANLVEAVEKKRMMVDGALSPREKAARMLLSVAIQIAKPFTIDIHQAGNAWDWSRKEMGYMDDPEFLLHALRHTCASRLVNAGVDLYVVKEWLGHSTIQITERYAHLTPDKLVHAANMLE